MIRLTTVANRAASALVLALFVAACNAPGQQGSTGPTGKQELAILTNNVANLDPQVVTDGMWFDPQGLLEGLVVQNDQGNDVAPGVADRWTVSSDAKTYTLHIRANAKWSNGGALTAQDFIWTYKRLLTPKTGQTGTTEGANSYQSIGIKGADDYLAGTLTDWSQVGIVAVDDHTLQFTLDNPNPDFLMGLAHPSMLPLNPTALQQHPTDWDKPANWVGNGPFVLDQWVVNSTMELIPNPNYWDRGHVFLKKVHVQFDTGNVTTLAFTTGSVDVMLLDAPGIRQFQGDPNLQKTLAFGPLSVINYIALLRSQNPALQDARVRQALSLALDRSSVAKITPGSVAATTLVPPSVKAWDKNLGTPYDPAKAKDLLSQAGYAGGKGLAIKIMGTAYFQPEMDALAQIWQTNLGIQVSEDVLDSGLYYQKRWQVQSSGYQGFYTGSYAGALTWSSWTSQLWGPQFTEKFTLPPSVWARYQQIESNATLDAATRTNELNQILDQSASPDAKHFAQVVAAAMATKDENQQIQLFKQADQLRESLFVFLPVTADRGTYAVRSGVQGLHIRATGDRFYLKGVELAS